VGAKEQRDRELSLRWRGRREALPLDQALDSLERACRAPAPGS